MKTCKREARINEERWFALYSTVDALAGEKPEDDAIFRFKLGRTWDVYTPPIMFCALNPSKATHLVSDSTVSRCCLDAKRWGFGGMFMMNVSPYRSTDPDAMKRFYQSRWSCSEKEMEWSDRMNRDQILYVANACPTIVCAWGNHGLFRGMGTKVKELLIKEGHRRKLHCYAVTKLDCPEHPLYQRFDSQLIPFSR